MNLSLRQKYSDKDAVYGLDELHELPLQVPDGEKRHVPVAHDECIVHTNDGKRWVWLQEGKQPLRKKQAIHISSFIVEQYGQLSLTDAMLQENSKLPENQKLKEMDATAIIYPGKNNDGWWNMEQLEEQVRLSLYLLFTVVVSKLINMPR
jgi:hypothetical protein